MLGDYTITLYKTVLFLRMYGSKCDDTVIVYTTEIVFVVAYEQNVALLSMGVV
jgi:hypothetical protein